MSDPITSTELATAAAITYRRLDYWIRCGLINTINPEPGHGRTRTHPPGEIAIVSRVARLLASGFGDVDTAFWIARELAVGPVALITGFVIADTTGGRTVTEHQNGAATHTATLTISPDDGWPRVRFTCSAGPLGQCRQICADATCQEEEYALQQAPDGTWFHTVYRDPCCGDECQGECDSHPEEVDHPMRDYGRCLVTEWLEETGVSECFEGPDDTPLNDTAVTYRWTGDGYLWRPAGEAP